MIGGLSFVWDTCHVGGMDEFWHEARVDALLKRPPSLPITQLPEPIPVRVRATTGTVTHYTPTHALYHRTGWAGERIVTWENVKQVQRITPDPPK